MIYIKNVNSENEIAKNHFIYIMKKVFTIVTEKQIRKRYTMDTTIRKKTKL